MDAENIISFVALVGLLVYFYFAFARLMQPGGDKHSLGRLSYGSAGAA
jgi:hypothetical protein